MLAAASALVGCIGPEVEPATDAELGSTRALIRLDSVAEGDEPQATAFAGFARIPADADAEAVIDLVGWRLGLPAPGTCAPLHNSPERAEPLAPVSRVEFLDAGNVEIRAGGARTTLAPRAFPTVSDLISGVVYTSRDANEEPLPSGVGYEIRTTGSVGLPPLVVSGEAPGPLTTLRFGGLPLAEIETLAISAPLDFTWDVGRAGDWVAVGLSLDAGGGVTCTFPDELGVGSLPAGSLSATGNGWLSVHRVRSVAITDAELDRGELRFSLERAIDVTFVP